MLKRVIAAFATGVLLAVTCMAAVPKKSTKPAAAAPAQRIIEVIQYGSGHDDDTSTESACTSASGAYDTEVSTRYREAYIKENAARMLGLRESDAIKKITAEMTVVGKGGCSNCQWIGESRKGNIIMRGAHYVCEVAWKVGVPASALLTTVQSPTRGVPTVPNASPSKSPPLKFTAGATPAKPTASTAATPSSAAPAMRAGKAPPGAIQSAGVVQPKPTPTPGTFAQPKIPPVGTRVSYFDEGIYWQKDEATALSRVPGVIEGSSSCKPADYGDYWRKATKTLKSVSCSPAMPGSPMVSCRIIVKCTETGPGITQNPGKGGAAKQ